MAKATRVRGLRPGMEFRAAAARIVAAKYVEMTRYTDAAISGTDAEALHDVRVSCKRLREAINVLRAAFGPSRVSSVRRDVELLNDGMGAVRESDVFLQWLEGAEEVVADDGSALVTLRAIRGLTESTREAQLAALEDLFADLLPDQLASDIAHLTGKAALKEAFADG